jgi:hypothetical protein
VIPGRVFDGELASGAEPERQERHQGEEAQQDRRSPGDGGSGPLALGFQAEMGAGFCKRHCLLAVAYHLFAPPLFPLAAARISCLLAL